MSLRMPKSSCFSRVLLCWMSSLPSGAKNSLLSFFPRVAHQTLWHCELANNMISISSPSKHCQNSWMNLLSGGIFLVAHLALGGFVQPGWHEPWWNRCSSSTKTGPTPGRFRLAYFFAGLCPARAVAYHVVPNDQDSRTLSVIHAQQPPWWDMQLRKLAAGLFPTSVPYEFEAQAPLANRSVKY